MLQRSGRAALIAVFALLSLIAFAGPAGAQVSSTDTGTAVVTSDTANTTADPAGQASINIDLGGTKDKPSQGVLVIILLTLLSVAPALIVMTTSFTRIIIVLSLTRNALGLQGIPPNQVLVGLALFLSLFVMAPTLKDINDQALQPMLNGDKTQTEAWDAAVVPMRTFMLGQTKPKELAMFVSASGEQRPETEKNVSLTTLLPAFILSELKTAFVIGFVIFVPFLIIDIAVSSTLMSMGMMMLPPVVVSLPFKLLLFVMVDGWGLVVRSLIKSF
ncbi:MAG: flagellar biosynthetic protein FliP [Acidimicrobiales bacterium]|nr:flagellar biosynthetic protein FliP [Acidimicrobiales bacterium]